jgi:hypothetical protein
MFPHHRQALFHHRRLTRLLRPQWCIRRRRRLLQ